MRIILHLFFILLFLPTTLQAQRASYFRRVFVDAEYYFLYEDYRDALPLYMELHNAFPDNANVACRIGLCYLNTPNEKHKALPFFEKASKSVTKSYNEGYFTETQAPYEVFLYYGRTLRIQNNFKKSSEAFKKYESLLAENDSVAHGIVTKERESLRLAQNYIENPVKVTFTSAGRGINSRFSEINPVVSADTNLMVFTSVQQFYSAIMVVNRRAKTWSIPLNINSQILADGEISTVGMSSDGYTVLFSRNDNDIFNLYTSKYDPVKDQWGSISRLPKEINSRNWENYASFSPSGDTIYFSSNRPEGQGGFDLYHSVRTPTGWSVAINTSRLLNTPFDEIAPIVSPDGKRLFFSSKGHGTMGGYDIFVSERVNGHWGAPVNLRYPINTTDDDVFYFPVGNGSSGYVSRVLPQSFGENDIYFLDFNLDSLIISNRNPLLLTPLLDATSYKQK